MNESPAHFKLIGYPFGAAVAASLVVLFIGMVLFGFQFAQWAEWEGRIVGIAGTVAAVAGAVVGLSIACRSRNSEACVKG